MRFTGEKERARQGERARETEGEGNEIYREKEIEGEENGDRDR